MSARNESMALVVKKKRGRPRKNPISGEARPRRNLRILSTRQAVRQSRRKAVLLSREVSAAAIAATKPRKSSRINTSDGPTGRSVDEKKPPVGHSVEGIVEGSFGGGHVVRVRIGDTDSFFRGVVFGPGLDVVAPRAKAPKRSGDGMLSALPPPPIAAGVQGYSPFVYSPADLPSDFDPSNDVLTPSEMPSPVRHQIFSPQLGYQTSYVPTHLASRNAS